MEVVLPCHYTPVERWQPEGEEVGGAPGTTVIRLLQRKKEQTSHPKNRIEEGSECYRDYFSDQWVSENLSAITVIHTTVL